MNNKSAIAKIERTTLDGAGVARVDGKVYFIDTALPDERVKFTVYKNKRRMAYAKLDEIIDNPSASRVEPDCQYFGVCGGCAFRHCNKTAQLQYKQTALLELLKRIGQTEPQQIMPAISGDWNHYRRKARLGVKHVEKKGGVIIGFREKNHSFITPLSYCLTLTKAISDLLPELAALLNQTTIKDKIPQIEVAHADNQLDLVFRHLMPFSDNDLDLIKSFTISHNIQCFSQSKGPDTIKPIFPQSPQSLYYDLKKHNIRLFFSATDFVQINGEANELLIDKVIELIEPNKDDNILDLYCGLGNFSLPLAKLCANVFAVEGESGLTSRGRINAQTNQITNINFLTQNLSDPSADYSWLDNNYTKLLLDPARSGAALICEKLKDAKINHIVYVSCDPATLARDANILVNQNGFKLTKAGIVNMFPHTAHVESIAVFTR